MSVVDDYLQDCVIFSDGGAPGLAAPDGSEAGEPKCVTGSGGHGVGTCKLAHTTQDIRQGKVVFRLPGADSGSACRDVGTGLAPTLALEGYGCEMVEGECRQVVTILTTLQAQMHEAWMAAGNSSSTGLEVARRKIRAAFNLSAGINLARDPLATQRHVAAGSMTRWSGCGLCPDPHTIVGGKFGHSGFAMLVSSSLLIIISSIWNQSL